MSNARVERFGSTIGLLVRELAEEMFMDGYRARNGFYGMANGVRNHGGVLSRFEEDIEALRQRLAAQG